MLTDQEQGSPTEYEPQLNSLNLDPEAQAIVDEHEALGVTITVTGGNKHMPDPLTLNAISLPKAMRNQGLGAALMEEPVDYADREGKTIKPCFPEDSAHQFKQWTVLAANASLSQFDSGQPENGPEFVVGAQQVGFVHW